MSKKDNFSQAAYEMFGIGRGGSKREADKTAEKPAESRFIHMNQEDIGAILGMTMESIMGEEELENLTNAFAKEVAEKPAAAPEEKKETKSGFWCR